MTRDCAICHQPFAPVGYWSISYAGKVEVWVTVKLGGQPTLMCPACLAGVIQRSGDDGLPREVSGKSRAD